MGAERGFTALRVSRHGWDGSNGGLRPPFECRLRAPRAIGLAGEADGTFVPPANTPLASLP